MVHTDHQIQMYQQLLGQTRREILGDLDEEQMARLQPRLVPIELPGGSVLMRQGEPSDAIYLVLAGRLEALRHDPERGEVVLGEIGRGQPIGEMGVITGEPRNATVRALRDCVLVRLAGEDFAEVLQSWPRAALPLARQLIERLSRNNRPKGAKRVVNLCVVPLHASLDAVSLAQRLRDTLAREVERAGQAAAVALHERSRIDAVLGPGAADAESEQPLVYRRLLAWLDEQEARHTLQVFAADAQDTVWTRLCLRHADRVLLVADADGDAHLQEIERRHLAGASPPIAVRQSLWLLHPDDRRMPQRTARWLHARPHLPLDGLSHFHCRSGHEPDWRRLARIVSGQACGLVLAGGGARGFAHLGVMQALEEAGIEWDMAGGTSIGAVMGAYAATTRRSRELIQWAARAFARDPTGDLNWLPMMSLLRGRRLRRVIEDAVTESMGTGTHVEDLWKPFFCIASNYSRAEAAVLREGPLADSLIASVSIPAALPPVLRRGDLLLDGGTFNNFPVDVMRDSGADRIIGVDLSRETYQPLQHAAAPSSWALFFDRVLRPRSRRRYKGFPSLDAIVFNIAVMASTSHQRNMRQQVDLGFQPDLSRVGLLDWKAFRRVVDLGLQHGRERLAEKTGTLSRHWYTAGVEAPPESV